MLRYENSGERIKLGKVQVLPIPGSKKKTLDFIRRENKEATEKAKRVLRPKIRTASGEDLIERLIAINSSKKEDEEKMLKLDR